MAATVIDARLTLTNRRDKVRKTMLDLRHEMAEREREFSQDRAEHLRQIERGEVKLAELDEALRIIGGELYENPAPIEEAA